MSAKPNYFKLGLFLIIAIILLVIAVVIWGAGLFGEDKIFFETYFDNSVSGLNPGATVEVSGVKLGQVESVEFASSVYDIIADPTKVSKYQRYVRVVCFILKEESERRVGTISEEHRAARVKEMVRQGLRLRLASNILTGQAYLEGVFLDPNRFVPLEITWQPHYLYVPSAPGAFSTLKESLDKILSNIEKVNVEALTGEMQAFFAELRQTNQRLQSLLSSPDPNAPAANVAQALERLDSVLEQIDTKMRAKGPEIDHFIINLRLISDDLKELAETLKRHPSHILFSKPPSAPESVK